MASSGSITTSNSSGYRNVTFSWSVQSQSVANNTTTISWSIVGAQDATDGWYYAGPFNLTIDGTKVVDNLYPSGDRIQLRKGTVVKTGTTTLTHAANGTKSFSATLSAAVYTTTAMSVTGTWSLDAIPRQSSASVAASYAIGSSHTISITRASTAYYHRVSYKFGSNAETVIATNATTSATLNLSSWGSNIPSAMSADITIYLKTYPTSSDATNQTNQIGSTATYPTTFNIPSYTQGAPSATVAEANTANTTGVYVQSISKLKYTLSATANYGATLSYQVKVAGQTMTGTSPLTTPSAINASGTVAATVTVTDSRGKTNSATVNTTVVAYSAPKITLAKAERNATTKTTINCTVSCSVSSILNGSTQKNTMTVYALYYTGTAPSPSSTYKVTTSGISASNATKNYTGLSASTVYYVQFRVVDIFGYTSQVVKVGTTDILHITASGIGVLKRRSSGALDVEGAINASQSVWGGDLNYSGENDMGVRSVAGSIYLFSNGNNGNRGIYLPAAGSASAKTLIYSNSSGTVYVDGKTPVYTSTDQTIAGSKTFTAQPHINSTARYNVIYCKQTNNTATNIYDGCFGFDFGNATTPTKTRFYIEQGSFSNGQGTGYQEMYWMPQTADGLTADANYYFLTTKSAVTVQQGGTGATNAANARANLGVNQPTLKNSTQIAGNATGTFNVTTANYNFYLFKFALNGVDTTIFTVRDLLDTTPTTYWVNDGTSSGAGMIITRTASTITVKRDGSTSCWCRLAYWN